MTGTGYAGSGTLEHALANGRRLLTSDPRAAAAQAEEILRISPAAYGALRLYARALRRLGNNEVAEKAELHAIANFADNPTLAEAANAFSRGDLQRVEHLLRPYVDAEPDDPAALTMLAEAMNQIGAHSDSEKLFRQALSVLPRFAEARLGLAAVLIWLDRADESLEQVDMILEQDPSNAGAAKSKGTTLGHLGRYDEALAHYESFLGRFPHNVPVRVGYGHMLKTVGRTGDAIREYRGVVGQVPAHGESWWSLANLKTVKLTEADIETMRAELTGGGGSDDNRLHLHFALAKALEDQRRFKESFGHYAEGNRIRRRSLPHDPELVTDEVKRSRALFTREFFAERKDRGCNARDPIFILGMPRAGSTLIEQILASHTLVEGTAELPHIPALVRGLISERWAPYPEILADLKSEELRGLGEEYLARTRAHRLTDRPFFVDKMPNNWSDAGFIHLILPRAKIIDARRAPMDCCFSNFKQHFSQGQSFSYDLADMGRYYRDYVELMDHIDTVLPGRVHRVQHERLIDNPFNEVEALLAYLELPFEEACLNFHRNARAVRTASSEQVRRPLNRDGVGVWRNYAPWLGPLEAALGALAKDQDATS